MDFSTVDLYVRLPLAFIYGYGYVAIHKVLQPLDNLYQKYARYDLTRRRRRLSDLAERPNAKTISDNISSPLLIKLPVEIRQMIYYWCYERSRFVLTREGTLPSKHVAWMHDKDWRYLREDPGIHRVYVQGGVLSLPLTCRQIYSETIDYIYIIPTFECFGFRDAFELPKVLLPERWSAVTKLHLWLNVKEFARFANSQPWNVRQKSDWEQFWQSVGALPHMERLEVHLGMQTEFMLWQGGELLAPQKICDHMLEPLLRVSNIPEFEVWVSKRLPSMDKYISAPFRLSWHKDQRLMHFGKDGKIFACSRSIECCALRF